MTAASSRAALIVLYVPRVRWGDIDDPAVINYREGVSWLIAARVLEYGKNLKIATDPGGGGGMYNLLVIGDAKTKRQQIHLNRNGSIHVFGRPDTRFWWPDDPSFADDVGDLIAERCGLNGDARQSRPAVSIARLIGQAILRQGSEWICHPASYDDVTSRTTEFEGTLFERFRGAQERLRVPSPLGGDAADRFFFLVRQPAGGTRPQPWLAFDMAGYAWMVDQAEPLASPPDWPGAVDRVLSNLPVS